MSEQFIGKVKFLDRDEVERVVVNETPGEIIAKDINGRRTIRISGELGVINVGDFQNSGLLTIHGQESTAVFLGVDSSSDGGGSLELLNDRAFPTVTLLGGAGRAVLGRADIAGSIDVQNSTDQVVIQLKGDEHLLTLSDDNASESIRLEGLSSAITLSDGNGSETIRLNGLSSTVTLNDDEGNETILLDGVSGDMGLNELRLKNSRTGDISIHMNGQSGNVTLGGSGHDGDLTLTDAFGQATITLDGGLGHAVFGVNAPEGTTKLENGRVTLHDTQERTQISFDGLTGDAKLSGDLTLDHITLQGKTGSAILGGSGEDGELTLKNSSEQVTISLDGNAGATSTGGFGQGGDFSPKNQSGQTTVSMTGNAGNISFMDAANCAVEFTAIDGAQAEPGTVMVMGDDGRLSQSLRSFDKRVVGVVSGAKDTQPGIVLDRQSVTLGRQPIALMGKAFCKVDATLAPIEVGDLLTTSTTAGHAMKVDNPEKGFGTVIGKALGSLSSGRGLLPVLISLQ